MSLTFAEPLWLWATVGALVLFGALLWYSAAARARQLATFADSSALPALITSHSPLRRGIKNALLFLAILAAGLALARPQWGVVEEEIVRQGEDVVFVLDLSKSMLTADVKPSRLERAKLAIQDYVHRQSGGRVGFVIFAGSAFVRVPLTIDYDAFEENVHDASPEDIYVPGSDVARALMAGKNAFDKTERRKIMILLSDGEDLEGNGVKVAEEIAKDGVIVFAVGIGTQAGGQVMVNGPGGRPTPLLDNNQQPVVSHLDETTLRAIATTTNGRYLHLDSISGTMSEIFRYLRTDASKGGLGAARRRGIDRYEWPLAICIFLLVVESLLTVRRRRPAAVPAA